MKFGEGGEGQGHVEILMAEVNFGGGDEDAERKEWVCDSGLDHHMTSDVSMFNKLEESPSKFFVKQKEKVLVNQWWVVRLSTEKGNGVKGELEEHEVLYMQWMRINIFSLQRIRRRGACKFTTRESRNWERSFQFITERGSRLQPWRQSKPNQRSFVGD